MDEHPQFADSMRVAPAKAGAAGDRRAAALPEIQAFAGTAIKALRRAAAGLVAFALPPRCPGCGRIVAQDHSFCLACWNALDFLGGAACAICAEPLDVAHHADTVCGTCLADPPPFARARAAVAYGPIARALALKLKYQRRPGLAVTMARLMRRRAGDLDEWLVVPVPLHRRRLWGRGYNQSALLACELVKGGQGMLAVDLLERRRATPVLRGMGPAGRRRAVSGAFAVAPAWRDRLRGRRVLLIDDVYTSGATLSACARTLRRAGAAEIEALCWARVGRDRQDRR